MNYYEHHIGDYAEATSHLTFIEDAAYSRLIRKYYSTEKPLPTDTKAVERLVAARTAAERTAVKRVLSEFFTLRETGWHNERCDEEIERFKSSEPERVIRKANEVGRLKRHRDERARLFADLHTAGQFPLWNIGMSELRTMHAKYCNVSGPENCNENCNASATAPETPATATHSPLPRHQTPDTNPNSVCVRGAPDTEGKGSAGNDADEHAHWEAVRTLYPDAPARADWNAAERAARRLVESGEATWQQIADGMSRYAVLCRATNRLVMNPAKFFTDHDKPWSQPWPLPPTKAEATEDETIAAGREWLAGSTS